MTSHGEWFRDMMKLDAPSYVEIGDDTPYPIAHVGKSKFSNCNQSFIFNNVLHVPSITKPLLSVKKFCKDNSCSFEFDDESCLVKEKATKKNPILKDQ